MGPSDAVLWAFFYMYHTDKANACMHCAPVKFSPITFRLFDELIADWPEGEDIPQEMAEVRSHNDLYTPDPGR